MFIYKKIFFLILLILPFNVYGESKIAYVDLDFVLTNINLGKKIFEKLEKNEKLKRETFNNKKLKKKFVFDYCTTSKGNVLRGFHLQTKFTQSKYVNVIKGKILDVVIDLRKNSKTYGKYFSIKISHDSNYSIYIPPGFAHGFLCLSKNCAVYYKCTNYRDKNSERTIKWNDKDLKIKWPIKNPILSQKDKMGIEFKDFK